MKRLRFFDGRNPTRNIEVGPTQKNLIRDFAIRLDALLFKRSFDESVDSL